MKTKFRLYCGLGSAACVGAIVLIFHGIRIPETASLNLRQVNAVTYPEESSVFFQTRGIEEAISGDYFSAIAAYDQALSLSPNNPDIYYNRAVAYYSIGNIKLALRDFEQMIQLQPNMAEAYANRGAIYFERGDIARALIDVRTASQLFEAQGQLQLAADVRAQFHLPED